jgi:dimethylargininase
VLRSEADRLTQVVVSTPDQAYFDTNTHEVNNIPDRPDPTAAKRQHDALKGVLQRSGASVVDVPELVGHPNSVFPRDVALCTPRGYVQLRMGIEARRGEEIWMSQVLEGVGEPCVGRVEQPGTAEGGDIILAGDVAFIGLSRRTNREGADQLSRLLDGMGYEARLAPVSQRYLHLGGPLSVIGERTLAYAEGALPPRLLRGFDVIEVPPCGPSPGNVICLGGGEVIVNVTENEAALERLEQYGFTVHGLNLSEFRKGGGGPTCLILPVGRG